MTEAAATRSDPMADVPVRRLRIAVESSPDVWHYIATILPYGLPDGGFAVVPAYPGHDGYASKACITDTFSHLIAPPRPYLFGGCFTTRRVKLSFHSDGVTQLSGGDGAAFTRSGRDQNGNFRGVGIIGRPFSNPVISGGVFSLTCWGLHHYPRARAMDGAIRFNNRELGRRGLLGRGMILLTGFLVSRAEAVERFDISSQRRIRSARWNGMTGGKERMELRVANLRNAHCYLAVDCIRIPKGQTDRNLAGFMMSSQRSRGNIGIFVVVPRPRNALACDTLDRGIARSSVIRSPGFEGGPGRPGAIDSATPISPV